MSTKSSPARSDSSPRGYSIKHLNNTSEYMKRMREKYAEFLPQNYDNGDSFVSFAIAAKKPMTIILLVCTLLTAYILSRKKYNFVCSVKRKIYTGNYVKVVNNYLLFKWSLIFGLVEALLICVLIYRKPEWRSKFTDCGALCRD